MATNSARVLLVEDELPIRRFVGAALTSAEYQLDEAATGDQALKHAAQAPPDIVILDLGLPDMDGQDVIRRLREWFVGPIVVLSARDQEQQKITALDNGADDYLTKPFSTAELLARIRVALRHAGRTGEDAGKTTFDFGDLKVDLGARHVFVRGEEVHLTPIEYKLLTTLVRHAGKVLTHRQLLKEVWGPQQTQETHYLRVFMATLRRKLEVDPAQPQFLLTEQGVGYRLASD
jgi:two-component system KDP operon response regulator KdpE